MKAYDVVLTDKDGKELAKFKTIPAAEFEVSNVSDDTQYIPITIKAFISPNELKRLNREDE